MWLWALSSWYFLSHVFISALFFFFLSVMTEKGNGFRAKKQSCLVFRPWLAEYFSFHFKVRKSHISLDIICKICYSVVFVISHCFWLSYCFALASAPSLACVMRPTCMFLSHSSQTSSVKYGHFLPFSSFMALQALWIRLNEKKSLENDTFMSTNTQKLASNKTWT